MQALIDRKVFMRNPGSRFYNSAEPFFKMATWDRPAKDAVEIDFCPFCGGALRLNTSRNGASSRPFGDTVGRDS